MVFFFLGLALGSAGLARSAASFANRIARRFAVRFRIAISAAAISAIALMPCASWAIFRFSRISFISAAVFGSSSIGCLKTNGRASSGDGLQPQSYHASCWRRAILGRIRREKRAFPAESAVLVNVGPPCAHGF